MADDEPAGGAPAPDDGPSEPERRRRGPYRKADDVRADLVAATIALLGERLPDRITVRDVAERAGVSHSLITRHFGTKDALVAEALRVLTSEYAAAVAAADGPVAGYLIAFERLGDGRTSPLALVAGAGQRAGGDDDDRFPGFAAHLRQLLEAGADDDLATRVLNGFLMAALAGWQIAEPTILDAGGLAPADRDAARREVEVLLRRLVAAAVPDEQGGPDGPTGPAATT